MSRPADLRAVRSVLSEEKKRPVAALSQTLPERQGLHWTPASAINHWHCSFTC
jgi:hypothetical protein